MNILNELTNAGLNISLAGAHLKVANPSRLTTGLRNIITTNKSQITKELTAAQIQHEIRGRLEDKPTVISSYCYRVTDKPNSILTVNTHSQSLLEITETLKEKYGGRLIEVYLMPTKH
jgi:hypothetical protein